MEERGREAERRTVTGKRRRQRLRQVRGIKGQRSCDKVCWDSMLTASVPALVNTIPVHFTGHRALCRALKDRSAAVERAFYRRPRKQRVKTCCCRPRAKKRKVCTGLIRLFITNY